MVKKTILVIDDEKTTHIILKAMLSDEYNLIFANGAQEGIDILGEKPVNLVLLDIQMPEFDGVELLESLMIDTHLQTVPIIIMTGKATEEIEKTARDLGAKEFMSKTFLFSEKEKAKSIIRKIALNESREPQKLLGYKQIFRTLMKSLLKETVKGDFIKACRKFGVGLINSMGIDYISFWTVQNNRVNLIVSLGDAQPDDFGPDEAKTEKSYEQLVKNGTPYLTNHPASGKKGFFANESMKKGLNSEIGVPMFKISREQLMYNNMKVPQGTDLFGFVIMKRSRVFTTKEFRLLSSFIIQSGTIFWFLYQRMLKNLS
ncbi:MAG: response regulator [Balneolaceae bacterium]|nr:response regulator [Balneolaceae bacterium]